MIAMQQQGRARLRQAPIQSVLFNYCPCKWSCILNYRHLFASVCYSPGLGADGATAEIIKNTCGDADVFVYVCDGTRALEETVMNSTLYCVLVNVAVNLTYASSLRDCS